MDKLGPKRAGNQVIWIVNKMIGIDQIVTLYGHVPLSPYIN